MWHVMTHVYMDIEYVFWVSPNCYITGLANECVVHISSEAIFPFVL